MAIEAGGKNGIFPVDDLTIEYMKEHSTKDHIQYMKQMKMQNMMKNILLIYSKLRPTVAFPHLPENTRTIDEVGRCED